MKVLMTCDAVGGVWRYANDLARGMAGQGVEVVLAVMGPLSLSPSREREEPRSGGGRGAVRSVAPAALPFVSPTGRLSLSPEGEKDIEVIRTDLPLDWLAIGPSEVLHAGRAIAALAIDHRADLVHLNSPALAALVPFPAPVVAMAHGCTGTWFAALGEDTPIGLAWHEELVREGLRAAATVVAPSDSYAAAVQRHYALPATPTVVHNGRAPATLASEAPADHVLTVGRLWDRVKNTRLLDAVAELLPVPLRAAGPIVAPHGETVATWHLDLLGTLSAEAIAAEYALMPIFVSAARFEPFGLAVLEAAQVGCPLVLADIDTFRELWTDAALLVSGDDPASYVAAIERIRTDPGLRAHLSDAARLRARQYSAEAMTKGTLAIYRDLLVLPQARAA